jgi:hypothetical protein
MQVTFVMPIKSGTATNYRLMMMENQVIVLACYLWTNTVVWVKRLINCSGCLAGKLGVGGLISAYKTTAQLTLESCL